MAKKHRLLSVQLYFIIGIISFILYSPSLFGEERIVYAAAVNEQLFASSESRTNCDSGLTGTGGSIDGAVNGVVDSCSDLVSADTEMWVFSNFGSTSAVTFTTLDVVLFMGSDGFGTGQRTDQVRAEIWIDSTTTWQLLTPDLPDNNGTITSYRYDISAFLTSPADVNAAQFRIYQVVPQRNAGEADTIVIEVDAVYLDIVGDDGAASNNPPTDIALSNDFIPENQPASTVVGLLTSSDPDVGDVHTYTLENTGGCSGLGIDNIAFQIGGVSGDELLSNASFDFETQNSYSVCVRSNDGNGGTFDKQFTINITDANDAPTDILLSSNSIQESLAIGTVVGSISSIDQDAADVHTYSLVDGACPGPDIASFSIDNGTDELKSAEVFNASIKSSYTICLSTDDGAGGVYEKQFIITITSSGNADPVAVGDSYSTTKNSSLNVSAPGVLGNDTDSDGDALSVDLPVVTNVSNGTLTINANGSFNYSPDNGFTGTDFFEYQASDGVGLSNIVRVDLVINNTPPVSNDDGPYTIYQDNPLDVPSPGVLSNDTDGNGDSLTAILNSGPSNAASFVLDATGSFSYSPNPGWTGTDSFTYFAFDGTDNSLIAGEVTIIVQANTPPSVTINTPGNGSQYGEGSLINFSGSANDNEDGNLSGSISWISNLDGSLGSGSSINVSTLSPGLHTITAQVTDSGNVTVTDNIDITIDAKPVITINEPLTGWFFTSGSTVSFDGVVTDVEDNDVSLTASMTWTSDIQSPSLLGTGGLFTRSDLIDGTHTVTISVTDSFSNTTVKVITITMAALPPSPHDSYSVTTDDCGRCHRTHSAGASYLINHTAADNTFCMLCHDGTGAVNVVSTHGNDNSPTGTHNSFELQCIQCHEPHGSSNDKAIRTDTIWDLGPPRKTYLTTFTLAGDWNNLCQECHTRVPGSTEFTHTGGTGHVGDPTSNCTTCHPHDKDADPITSDGFMPSGGGGCTGCHASSAGSIPRRAIVGSSGDFEQNSDRRSHHYISGSNDPADDQCKVCHDITNHDPQNNVQVYDMDTGATLDLEDGVNDSAQYEQFCLSCHDGDGVTNGSIALPTGGSAMDPFADGNAPPDISAGWMASSHNSSSNVGSCINCHDNGHGSNKLHLLSFWKYVSTPDDDPYNEEEDFCFACHDGSTATTDIAGLFARAINWSNAQTGSNNLWTLNDRHDVQLSGQTMGGIYTAQPLAVLECTDCHNVHADTSSMKVKPDPDPTDGRVPGVNPSFPGSTFMSDWCLDCHDLSLPPGVIERHDNDTDPGTTNYPGLWDIFTYWNGDNNKDDTHGHQNGGVKSITADVNPPTTQDEGDGWIINIALQCMDCHVPHVGDVGGVTTRASLFLLKYPIMSRDGLTQLNSNASNANGATPTMAYEYSYASTFISDNQNGYSWCNTCHDGANMKSGQNNCAECHNHGGTW